ncbi:MAG: hypothetical protein NVS2B7_24860 [Herpetosiphon sp.]
MADGKQQDLERTAFRFGPRARQRAVVMTMLVGCIAVGLAFVLVTRWSGLPFWTKVVGVLLAGVCVATLRSQVTRAGYRLYLHAEGAIVKAPLLQRQISWQTVVEVRRMVMPQFGRAQKWACTVYVGTSRGTRLPILLFDNELERAEEALHWVLQATPHATHAGIELPAR